MRRAILPALACILMATSAFSATLTVPVPYSTIQKAVDAASPNDTVLVAAGTYRDCTHPSEESDKALSCVVMKSGVTLLGAGAGVTTIDAELLGMCIYCKNVTNAVIEGFTLINADCLKGGWLYAPAIFCRLSDPDIRNCDIGPNYDGGIICAQSASPSISYVNLTGNTAKSGGGIHMEGGSNATIVDCDIEGNQAPIGGGIYCSGSNPFIMETDIRTNSAGTGGYGGGGIFKDSSAPTILSCGIVGNTTVNNGAGLCFIESAGSVTDCTIRHNDVTGDFGQGGGICFLQNSTTTVELCKIVSNTTSGDDSDGGGIYCKASDVTITSCTIARNSIAPGGSKGRGVAGGITFYGCAPTIEKTIVAFSTVGAGLGCLSSADPQISCCDVYGNVGGDGLCGTDGGGNFSANPVFCDTMYNDYTINSSSPCAPGNHPAGSGACGDSLIGSEGTGCFGAVEDEGVRITRNPLVASSAPNPFNLSTTIEFALTEPTSVTLRVYDVTGREVASLKECPMSIGTHRVTWDGTTRSGARASSGIYFYRLAAGDHTQTGRMVMVK